MLIYHSMQEFIHLYKKNTENIKVKIDFNIRQHAGFQHAGSYYRLDFEMLALYQPIYVISLFLYPQVF